jgi:type III secretory pathway component EscS
MFFFAVFQRLVLVFLNALWPVIQAMACGLV